MEFLKTIKIHGLNDLLRAKDREKMRGMIEAENDLEGILITYEDFSDLYAYMTERFVKDGESVLYGRLLENKEPEKEARIIAQIKHMRALHKKFMKYASQANTSTTDTR